MIMDDRMEVWHGDITLLKVDAIVNGGTLQNKVGWLDAHEGKAKARVQKKEREKEEKKR